MRRRLLGIFVACQMLGFGTGMAASHGDTMLWVTSGVLLLPGMLVDAALFKSGAVGSYWPKWTLFAIPVASNVSLCLLIALLMRYRTKRNVREV